MRREIAMIFPAARRTSRRNVDAAALTAFERLLHGQFRRRLRTAIWLALALVPAGALGNALFLPDRLAERLVGFAAILALNAGVFAALRTRLAQTHPEAIAVSYVALLNVPMLYLLSLSPTALEALVAPLGVMMIATPLLFPWGGGPQAALSGATIAGFSIVLVTSAPPDSRETTYSVTLALLMTASLSVVTACLLDHLRFETCVARWRVQALAVQRRRLLQLGRELRETLDPELLLARIAHQARRLVRSDFVSIGTRDLDGSAGLRLAAVEGDPRAEGALGLDLPPEYSAELCASLARTEVQESPGADIDPFVDDIVQSLGYPRRLTVAVGPSHRLIGFIAWHRRENVPFTPLERLAALGIADQTYTTLSAARLYASALESSRLKSEFVSTVSHEFRTPLSVIIGYSDMAADTALSDSDRLASLGGIAQSARELLLLVEHTLDISRLDAGKDRVDLEAVSLQTFWRGLMEMCRHLPRTEGVELQWPHPLPNGLIRTDRRRLGIIVRNLVSNALKFTEQGRVTVSLDRRGSRLVIRVRDTGIGIAPEDQPAIFEVFRQVDGSETRRFKGTGLGLYIVSRFVEQLRGRLRLESEVGRGSLFEIEVPGLEGPPRPVFAEPTGAAYEAAS